MDELFEPMLVTTTADRREVLDELSAWLVSKKLAACCQVSGPATSHYCWRGKQQADEEWICQIKTARHLLDELFRALSERHPYDEPELIAVPIVESSPGYRRWMQEQLKRSG